MPLRKPGMSKEEIQAVIRESGVTGSDMAPLTDFVRTLVHIRKTERGNELLVLLTKLDMADLEEFAEALETMPQEGQTIWEHLGITEGE